MYSMKSKGQLYPKLTLKTFYRYLATNTILLHTILPLLKTYQKELKMSCVTHL